jgi:CRISPR-associated endonuclease/helicase Cas3
MPFFAHSVSGQTCNQWQTVHEHLVSTAHQAGEFAAAFASREWGDLCGLLHDLGKYSPDFQKRLEGGKPVDHSLAGALEAVSFLRSRQLGGLANIVAHVISGHHTGLADGIPGEGEGVSLKERLDASGKIPDYSAWKTEIQLPRNCPPLPSFSKTDRSSLAFSLFFWTRMLYSCLVDADFLNTEAFLQPEKAALRGLYPKIGELRAALNAYLEKLSTQARPGNVNTQRATVLAACRRAAPLEQGLFSLTVPTGGGKTLSSLAFALDHAARHSLRRVIYVIPYTSIIEQTAGVFRVAFGPALAKAVVEHHANAIEKDKKTSAESDWNEDARSLAFENWDAPIIVTTAVQFFESLFAARSSRCRKLHHISGSVVVLDEAQTLPTPLFRPCLAAINELTGMYKTSIVLCTATQPEVGLKPWNRNGLENVREIAPDVPKLFRELERVTVEFTDKMELPELAARLSGHERALCIVNTRAQARDVCELLRASVQDGKALFHLSTWMCPAHRQAVLQQIKAMLLDPASPPMLLVATSLIEAGVDQDWPVVYRALTGLDSIAQAAGRCNREGRLERGRTFVFDLPGKLRGEQDRRRSATECVRRAGLPVLSPEATALYFSELHSLAGVDGLDKPSVLGRAAEHAAKGFFPFRSLARDFRFIEDYELPLLIPYNDEARVALERVRAGEADRDLYRRLQQWTVGVPEKALCALGKSAREIGFAGQHYELINDDLYSGLAGRDRNGPALGLDLRKPVFREVEGLLY